MDIYFYGQACFKIKGKTASIIIDPYDPEKTGLKLPKDMEANLAIKTHDHSDHNFLSAVTGDPIEIVGPGDYDIKGVGVSGVGVYHDDKRGEERGKNTVYHMQIDGVNVVHLGDLGHILTQEQIEEIGSCDVLMVPVGGLYTIDAKDASEVISQLEPSVIIPMHYKLPGLKYELAELEEFLKQMGSETIESAPKLTITKDKLPDEPQVVVLSKV